MYRITPNIAKNGVFCTFRLGKLKNLRWWSNSKVECGFSNLRNIEAHYFFRFPDELSFGKVIFTKTTKYSTSLNDISKKKIYLKNSKRLLKGKSGTFRCYNEFLQKQISSRSNLTPNIAKTVFF